LSQARDPLYTNRQNALKLGKEPGNGKEIRAAARAQVPFNQVRVEVDYAGLETGRQDAVGLDQIPGLGLNMSQTCKSTPMDQVCIVIHGQQVEQRLVKGLVFPAPAGKDSFHGGKAVAACSSEAGGGFATDPGQAVSLKQLFACRLR
jgi:hypothetical protein